MKWSFLALVHQLSKPIIQLTSIKLSHPFRNENIHSSTYLIICTFLHVLIETFTHWLIHSFIWSFKFSHSQTDLIIDTFNTITHWLAHILVYSNTITHWLAHIFVYSNIRLLTQLFTPSRICPIIQWASYIGRKYLSEWATKNSCSSEQPAFWCRTDTVANVGSIPCNSALNTMSTIQHWKDILQM